MRIKPIFDWGMYNWAVTPSISVWRNSRPWGFGFAIHFLRGRIGFYL